MKLAREQYRSLDPRLWVSRNRYFSGASVFITIASLGLKYFSLTDNMALTIENSFFHCPVAFICFLCLIQSVVYMICFIIYSSLIMQFLIVSNIYIWIFLNIWYVFRHQRILHSLHYLVYFYQLLSTDLHIVIYLVPLSYIILFTFINSFPQTFTLWSI